MRILYTVAVFVSSALLFLVEPMIAKMILPRFGGSPSVWNASMLFFQIMLLAGYAYSHFSTKWLGVRRQAWLHLALMAVAAASLPFALPPGLSAQGSANPLPALLALLGIAVGPTFFLVSAGAPLLQRWFGATYDAHAADPYFLYSASNLGSLIALLAYPALVEPDLRLGAQAGLWQAGYGVLVVGMVACAVALFRAPAAPISVVDEPSAAEPVTNRDRLKWVALAAVPSSLLLGVTAYITSNVAPVPLLWVVPLALYLLTFVLAFARKPFTNVPLLGRILPLLVTPLALVIILENWQSEYMIALAALHLGGFFVAAWMCHGRLVASRPDKAHLTEFYLWMSFGGVVGGVFNAIVAPVIFSTYIEYPLALAAACLFCPPRVNPKRPQTEDSPRSRVWDFAYPALVGAISVGIVLAANAAGMPYAAQRTGLTIGVPIILAFLSVDRPIRYGLSLAVVFVYSQVMHVASSDQVLLSERSFFGVHRVLSDGGGRFTKLVHGTTVHGIQDHQNPRTPLSYYHPSGPIGQVFQAFSGPNAKKRVAVVGLGIGSLAAYGEPGQKFDYYEIDPVVNQLAHDTRYFTFLADSRADVSVTMGDARIELAKAPASTYGLIVLDAFSSDSIPVHLLTEEAARMYVSKLAPRGIIAYHLSNRYLDLDPFVGSIAQDLGMACLEEHGTATQQEMLLGKYQSEWMILARNTTDFGPLANDTSWSAYVPPTGSHAWTDDFSNVLGAFRSGGP